jgi:hypothetical protein
MLSRFQSLQQMIEHRILGSGQPTRLAGLLDFPIARKPIFTSHLVGYDARAAKRYFR